MKSTSLALAAALASSFLAGSAHAQQAILAHIMDDQHIFDHVSQMFMKELDSLSGGTMSIDYHPGGDLGDWTAITEQVAQGAIEMTMTYNHSELSPAWDVAILGYVASDWETGKKVYGPDSGMDEVYSQILSDLNLTFLGTIPTDFTGYIVRKGVTPPTEFPEGANGFKMRVPGMPMAIERYTAAGFSPVPMAFSEVYTALQTGGIDGRAYGPPSEVLMFKDVISSYVFTRENFEHTFWVANKQWFEGLSEEQQGWVTAAADKAVAWSWGAAESQSAEWLDKIRAEGIEVIELSDEQLAKYKAIVTEVEYPYMEKIIGSEIMGKIKAAAGLN